MHNDCIAGAIFIYIMIKFQYYASCIIHYALILLIKHQYHASCIIHY